MIQDNILRMLIGYNYTKNNHLLIQDNILRMLIDHHDFFFGDLFDSQTRLIENKYGIHDGSSEGFNKPGVFDNSGEITIFDSYEIEDFYGCCKEWYLFFDSLDMIQNDDK